MNSPPDNLDILFISRKIAMHSLTLDQANTIVNAARQAARAAKYKPMGIVVLDASGQLVAFAREQFEFLLLEFQLIIATW